MLCFCDPPGVSLCSSEGLAKVEVQVPDDVEIGSEDWFKYLEDLEMSLGLADV